MGEVKPVGFLAHLTSSEQDALEGAGTRRNYARGEVLFRDGESPDTVIIVLDGRVKISSLTEEGREVVLAVIGPGDILGEIAVLEEVPRSATATALDSLQAVVIGAAEFRNLLERHPRIAVEIIKMTARRLREADRKRISFSAFDTIGRVANLLVELVERFGEASDDGVRITLPLSQLELAGWTGSSREAVNKAFQVLRQRGWIQTHRRGITVIDLEALRARAI